MDNFCGSIVLKKNFIYLPVFLDCFIFPSNNQIGVGTSQHNPFSVAHIVCKKDPKRDHPISQWQEPFIFTIEVLFKPHHRSHYTKPIPKNIFWGCKKPFRLQFWWGYPEWCVMWSVIKTSILCYFVRIINTRSTSKVHGKIKNLLLGTLFCVWVLLTGKKGPSVLCCLEIKVPQVPWMCLRQRNK